MDLNRCINCNKIADHYYNGKNLCEYHYYFERKEQGTKDPIVDREKIRSQCLVDGCKEMVSGKDDINYYGLRLIIGLCKKHSEDALHCAIYSGDNKMDKPKRCPLARWNEREGETRNLNVEHNECFVPYVFAKHGCPENFFTEGMFRCPECYTDGRDYIGCDIFSQWWWLKFGSDQKITNNGNGKRSPITQSLRHEVFKRDEYKCKECGSTKDERTLHVDHIIPISQGGTDELANLQTLCDKCNLAKSNRKW